MRWDPKARKGACWAVASGTSDVYCSRSSPHLASGCDAPEGSLTFRLHDLMWFTNTAGIGHACTSNHTHATSVNGAFQLTLSVWQGWNKGKMTPRPPPLPHTSENVSWPNHTQSGIGLRHRPTDGRSFWSLSATLYAGRFHRIDEKVYASG